MSTSAPTTNAETKRRCGLVATGTLAAVVVLALAGCAAAPPAREAGPPRADARDLVAIHTVGSPQYSKACLDCHGDIMKRPTLDPKVKDAHAAMVPFMPDYDAKAGVTNDNCASCHTRVDLVQHSGTQLRKNADVTTCESCHGKSGTSSKKFYAN
jgi:cytochrome c553